MEDIQNQQEAKECVIAKGKFQVCIAPAEYGGRKFCFDDVPALTIKSIAEKE
jgi:hypothetical protein